MGFKASKVIKGDIPKDKVDPHKDLPHLSSEELMFLIKYIGQSQFNGKDVEIVYKLVYKLQEIYTYHQKQ
tara:strand:- start:405 stop:614 length:210 start_codon:yes stop_codon:yes gene_type:complete